MNLKLGPDLNLQSCRYVSRRKLRLWVIGTAFVCLILGVGLGLAWSLASKRNHVNYCLQWNSQTHKMERVME